MNSKVLEFLEQFKSLSKEEQKELLKTLEQIQRGSR